MGNAVAQRHHAALAVTKNECLEGRALAARQSVEPIQILRVIVEAIDMTARAAGLAVAGALWMIFVLTTQNRQAKLAEQRAHLDLQINLLSEQKAAKIISLLEELRHDLPNVRDRVDQAAEAMKEAADPVAVLTALEDIESSEPGVRGNK